MLPVKRSNMWIVICIIYTLFVLASFVINQVLIQTPPLASQMIRLFLFSAIVAIWPCLAGYFGQQLFFYIYTIFTLIAILYMMYIVYAHTSQGWEDLTSLISFIIIILVGCIVAFIAQLLSFLVKKRKKSM